MPHPRDGQNSGNLRDEVEMDGLVSTDEEEEFEADDEDEERGLTHAERKERWRKMRRRTGTSGAASNLLDDKSSSTDKLVTASLMRKLVVNGLLIGLWYSFSIAISVYNRWMFGEKTLNFKFPLFVTSLHMVVQFLCAATTLFFIPRFRPKRPSADNLGSYTQLNGSTTTTTSPSQTKKAPIMTKSFYLTRIAPCSTATALDIGLGNFSLRFIHLTFFTMCKSSVLAFVLLFAFLFKLEEPTWRLCAIILFMTLGVIMMVAGESAFNLTGFLLVMSASFCSGFRWSLTQILLLRNPATSNPFSSIFFLTPVMFGVLLALALPAEGPLALIAGLRALADEKGTLFSIVVLIFPGSLAFLMVAAEFALLQRTSVVTLSVCGIFKEVLTISAAGIAFDEKLSPINISGLLVTLVSIAAYNYLKYTKMRSNAKREVDEVLSREEREGEDSDHPGKASRGIELDDRLPRPEESAGLMRESLARNANGHMVAPHGDHISHSPVKQAEHLE